MFQTIKRASKEAANNSYLTPDRNVDQKINRAIAPNIRVRP